MSQGSISTSFKVIFAKDPGWVGKIIMNQVNETKYYTSLKTNKMSSSITQSIDKLNRCYLSNQTHHTSVRALL